MKRRDFLRTAGGAAGAATATAAASSAAAESGVGAIQDGNTTQPGGNQTDAGGNQTDGGGNQTDGGGGLPGAGQTQTIAVGPDGDYVFAPESVEILPGTQVVWEWESDTHNIVPDGQPGEANWSGHTPIEDTGFTYSHTFTVEGEYGYYCDPHRAQGMTGTLTVTTDANAGGGGYEPPDPAHMGIPIQKHFVGALAFMGVFVTLVFTFYLLKYGESAHTAAPGKRD